MRIEWDEPKRLANLDKHGMDFVDLEPSFFDSVSALESRLGRFVATGFFKGSAIVVVYRPLGTEAVSVISMRKASKRERTAP